MKNNGWLKTGEKLVLLCIAALLVSQAVTAFGNDVPSPRPPMALNEAGTSDCLGEGANGLDCVIPSVEPNSSEFPVYVDPYQKCEINLSKSELKKEEKLQNDIDALYEKVNGLYEKLWPKYEQLPNHFDQTCIEQIDRENMMKQCNLTDESIKRVDTLQSELNALYQKLGNGDDERTWEEINQKQEELNNLLVCDYSGPFLPYEEMYSGCELKLTKAELNKEARVQAEIDALSKQIDDLYTKINEKSAQLPQHYDQKCIEEVDREMLKERCNLSDDELAKIEAIQSEINALYSNLQGANDDNTWEEINRKGEEINAISSCVNGPMMYTLSD
jgi:hypothetical protein